MPSQEESLKPSTLFKPNLYYSANCSPEPGSKENYKDGLSDNGMTINKLYIYIYLIINFFLILFLIYLFFFFFFFFFFFLFFFFFYKIILKKKIKNFKKKF